MLIAEHSVKSKASAQGIWTVWSEVDRWREWDSGIEWSRIDGPFAVGTTGELKPRGGPLVKTRLTCVEPCRRFVDEADLFWGKIRVSHEMVDLGDDRLVTHRIEIEGALAPFYYFVMGRAMRANLPLEMERMVPRGLERGHPI